MLLLSIDSLSFRRAALLKLELIGDFSAGIDVVDCWMLPIWLLIWSFIGDSLLSCLRLE